MAYSTKADLEMAVGGAARLVQLLDKDGDGIADEGMVQKCLETAMSEVDSAVQIRHSLPLQTPYPAILKAVESAIAAYYAHMYGTDGQGLPPQVRAMFEDARNFLTEVSLGRRTLAVANKPATDLHARQIDPDPYLRSVSRRSLKGLW